jgi:hypothetical protein
VTVATKDAQSIIQQVIRGERPGTDLSLAGMNVGLEGNRCAVENLDHVSVSASIQDLARGFQAYLHDPQALRDWAFLVEAIDVDLDVENHPAGEMLLHALRDASFGNPLTADIVGTIKRLANDNGGEA